MSLLEDHWPVSIDCGHLEYTTLIVKPNTCLDEFSLPEYPEKMSFFCSGTVGYTGSFVVNCPPQTVQDNRVSLHLHSR
jgi:hypothetical protein